jgi:hypothetical protein
MINSRDLKLIDILFERYGDEMKLNIEEGLIKTTDINQTIHLLKKQFKFIFTIDIAANTFNIEIEKANKKEVDDLLKATNNLGWFPAYMSTPEYMGKWSESKIMFDESLVIDFEAKYDTYIEKTPEFLYHIAPEKNWTKIEKIGLTPKSRSKLSYHPDRVYLAKTEKDAKFLVLRFKTNTKNGDWVLLKIDTSYTPYIRLYQDPNYKQGYYTMNNIPPSAITKIEDINI